MIDPMEITNTSPPTGAELATSGPSVLLGRINEIWDKLLAGDKGTLQALVEAGDELPKYARWTQVGRKMCITSYSKEPRDGYVLNPEWLEHHRWVAEKLLPKILPSISASLHQHRGVKDEGEEKPITLDMARRMVEEAEQAEAAQREIERNLEK